MHSLSRKRLMSSNDVASQYLPTKGVLKTVGVFLILYGLATLFTIAAQIVDLELLFRSKNGGAVEESELTGLQVRSLVVMGLAVLTILPSLISYMFLAGRLNHNARKLGAKGLSQTPGWATWCYIIPIANIFMPYRNMVEMWKIAEGGPKDWMLAASSPVVGTWWGLVVVSAVLSRVAQRMGSSEDPAVLIGLSILVIVACVLDIARLYFSYRVVAVPARAFDELHANGDGEDDAF